MTLRPSLSKTILRTSFKASRHNIILKEDLYDFYIFLHMFTSEILAKAFRQVKTNAIASEISWIDMPSFPPTKQGELPTEAKAEP